MLIIKQVSTLCYLRADSGNSMLLTTILPSITYTVNTIMPTAECIATSFHNSSGRLGGKVGMVSPMDKEMKVQKS